MRRGVLPTAAGLTRRTLRGCASMGAQGAGSPLPSSAFPLPKVGDALVYNRHIYYHSAVYIGTGELLLSRAKSVLTNGSVSGEVPPNCLFNVANAYAAVLKDNHIDPVKHYVIHYVPPTGWHLGDKLRHGLSRSFTVELMEYNKAKRGSRIFIVARPSWINGRGAGVDGHCTTVGAPLSSLQEERLDDAIVHYKSQLGGYNFFFNNCQHFSTFIAFGHGALFPWSFVQITLFLLLVTYLSGRGIVAYRCDASVDGSGPDRPSVWPYAVVISLALVMLMGSRHGMVLRLVRCADPV